MSAPKKPSLTTSIPPINREPVELDGTPTSPHGPRFSTSSTTTSTLQRPIPRADTLDSASTLPSSAATMSPDSAAATTAAGASAMAEANLEGARVGAGVDAAALRMNGQVGGSRTGEGELVGGEEEEEELVREHRAALLSSRSRDPAVLVDIPQLPAPEELAAVGATSDAADGEVGL